jgi:GNAT superfamily N-acetyltransferase
MQHQISELQNTREAAQAAEWIYQEWTRFEANSTWKENQIDIAHALNPTTTIPKFFGCRVDGALVGIASVVPHDLPTHPQLGPWLANVLVLPQWRSHGIGSALVRHVMNYAVPLAEALYLYTFDQVDLYQRLGWQQIERVEYVGRAITLMRYSPV